MKMIPIRNYLDMSASAPTLTRLATGLSATLLVLGLGAVTRPAVAQDPGLEAARRVVALSALGAKEYAEGSFNGTIVSNEEVEEARLFLTEARRAATGLPAGLRAATLALLDSAAALVDTTGPAARLSGLAGQVDALLRHELGALGDAPPSLRPSYALGRRLFLQHCTECHGDGGAGDGFRAPRLDPPPADLTDAVALADQSPLDHFRKIRLGVSGTDMEGFEDVLEDDEIWAVAWYVTRLRSNDETRDRGAAVFRRLCRTCQPPDETGPGGLSAAPADLADPEATAAATDEQMATAVRRMGASAGVPLDSTDTEAVVQYLRTLPLAWEDASGAGRSFALTHTQLARAMREARDGKPERASALVFDAYSAFEAVEADVRLRDPALVGSVEAGFSDLRGQLAGGTELGSSAQSYRALTADLRAAQEVLEGPSSPVGLFLQSFVLLLREGLEAILIVGALATVVVRAGVPERRRDMWWGVGGAVVASVVTAVLLESVFRLGVAEREALEGIVMLLATAVLLSVSYWLLAKVEVRHWKEFVTTKARQALTSGSMWTLAGAAFLAVYREGFETVLFYKALFITAEGHGAGSIAVGGVAAAFCLIGVYWGIAYAGLRIPMRAFFGTTSAILFYMAFTFAGKGIAELQESQLLHTTLLDWAPSVPWMGIYPTVQTTVIQVGLLGLLLFGVVWTFVMHPRRMATRMVLQRGPRDR
jgi:high-affinity iron transporter